ncbi:hypothetical protein QR680_019041 [Steinernema hermaphroditum]|uniref:Nucleosome assembly protein 1-like 4 n=1 Tax=Steinernema hermaphroditum TaxID=289476 RepID=A0AA39HKR5_9BILA|nr:hypothetical protein QR680_019041 [Steinernema hermaphroditum]
MGVPAECDLSIPFPPHMADTTEKTRRTVRAVKNIQRRAIDLEAKYFQRLQEVDQEFQLLFDKLHEERHAFVTGAKEPTDEEANISLFHDVDKEELEKLEQQWNKENPEKGERGIPEFWLHALMNFPPTSDMICEDDARLLARLNDITCAIETAPPAFTLRFHFDRNEYFTNSVLEKRYVLDITPDPEHPFSFDGPQVKEITGTKIDWYEGKNITKKVIKTRYRTKVGGMKMSIKTVKQDSFFNFFEAPPKPADKDDFEALDAMEHDYTIGDEIREDLIPRAVLFYTAEITEDEESDDEFGDLDLDVDDEEEGDENEDENEAEE